MSVLETHYKEALQVQNIPGNIDLANTVKILSQIEDKGEKKKVNTTKHLYTRELKEFEEIKSKMLENEKKLNLEGCFIFNNDGTIGFTDKIIKELETQKKFFENRGLHINNANTLIDELLYDVIKPGDVRAIQYNRKNRGKIKDLFEKNNEGKYSRMYDFIDGFGENFKLIPSFVLGYDADFLSNIKDSHRIIKDLRNVGITLEESKTFLEKYIEISKIDSLNNIDLDGFLYGKLNSDMIEFLLGANYNENIPYDFVSNINVSLGLKLYKMKSMWGDNEFINFLSISIDKGLLNNEYRISSIDNILKSGMRAADLPKYIELCQYLKDKGCNECPNLEGYTSDNYLKIMKYIGAYCKSFDKYFISNYVKIGEILYKNGIPGNALDFFCNHMDREYYNDFVDAVSPFKEIFGNNEGKELYLFLSKYPQKLQNLGGKEIQEIDLTTKQGGYNFCFRGILEMIKSREDINAPILGNNYTKSDEIKWENDREKIIKEYEKILRNYILLDKDENGKEKPRNKTFDKIFFANANSGTIEDKSGATEGNGNLKGVIQSFTNTKNFEDYSNKIDENGNLNKDNQKNMIEKIKEYANSHPNEKILVYLGYHGGEDGSSSNDWDKKNRGELSNISENIKIMSIRCFFGTAYTGDKDDPNYIYGINSPVSGFSTNNPTKSTVVDRIWEGHNKGLGFHELEIYTRLHYNYSFTPLTEFVDYTDFSTGKKTHGKIGIADAGNGKESNVYYG